MQPWTQLSRLALIGTEHQALEPVTLGDGALDELLARLGPAAERELHLLKTAAALTLAQRAGYQPGSKTPVAFVAAPETQPRCPTLAGHDLARMLRGYLPQILPEWMELAQKQGRRVPEELLPELLEHAKRKSELRAPARAVLGQRGAWLAGQNPDWSFAISVSDSEKSWQEGQRPERLAALREIRQADPQRARELLAASWKNEPPQERVEFVQVLAANLSMDDEPFLESALDDKRKEVRGHVLALLGGMTQTRLVRRMTELATPLIQFKKQLLRAGAIEVTLPAELTKEMSRYGVGVPRPRTSELGEKAGWLEFMLEFTPPSHWTARFDASPKELLAAAVKSDWAKALLYGWAMATARFDDGVWINAWIDAAAGEKELLAQVPTLGTCDFTGADREAVLVKLLGMDLEPAVRHFVQNQVQRAPRPWGNSFSQAVLREIQAGLALSPTDYVQRSQWQQLMGAAPVNLPLAIPQLTSMWPKEIGQESLRKVVDEFCAIIEFRRSIHRHFQEEK